MNVLFHQGALGDWVLTFPILRALSGPTVAVSSYSKAQLAAELFAHVRAMNAEGRDLTGLFATGGAATAGPDLCVLMERARLIISFVSSGTDTWAENVAALAPRAPLVFVPPRPPPSWPGHIVKWHAVKLAEQGISGPSVPIRPRAADHRKVAIHPGSGASRKCWPADRFEVLIERMREAGCQVRVLLGEVELERWPKAQMARWRLEHGAQVIQSLAGLHAHLGEVGLFVGNDSGPTHLAAQLGLTTVALFGPSSPRQFAPRGPAVTVLAPAEPAPMSWLDVPRVWEACRS